MKKIIFALIALCQFSFAQGACPTILTLESDDPIYPGRGEVQLCTNSSNQLTKLIVVKPVQNPYRKDPDSNQADERNPILHISIEQINSAKSEIAILTPSRMGVTVKAAVLEVPTQKIDKDKGGEVVLKVIKSKVAGSYHRLRLQLKKLGTSWEPYLVEGTSKTHISHFYFKSGVAGIRKVEFN